MILDDNLVFLDGAALTGTATSEPVALNALFRPGSHHDAIPLTIRLSADAKGGESLELKLQQADTAEGEYADVPGATLSVPADELRPGARVGWRHLPHGVTKSWIKLTATPAGFSGGTIVAALTREDEQPWSEGMYINAGKVIG